MATRLEFARAILQYGHFQTGAEHEQGLIAVMTGEASQAHWNPLDTTLFAPGATPFNSFGPNGEYHVWNFATALDGVHNTVATINQENMRPWFNALKASKVTAASLCQAFAKTPWGGIGDVLPLDIVLDWNKGTRNYVADRGVVVAGSGPWPFDVNGRQVPS